MNYRVQVLSAPLQRACLLPRSMPVMQCPAACATLRRPGIRASMTAASIVDACSSISWSCRLRISTSSSQYIPQSRKGRRAISLRNRCRNERSVHNCQMASSNTFSSFTSQVRQPRLVPPLPSHRSSPSDKEHHTPSSRQLAGRTLHRSKRIRRTLRGDKRPRLRLLARNWSIWPAGLCWVIAEEVQATYGWSEPKTWISMSVGIAPLACKRMIAFRTSSCCLRGSTVPTMMITWPSDWQFGVSGGVSELISGNRRGTILFDKRCISFCARSSSFV